MRKILWEKYVDPLLPKKHEHEEEEEEVGGSVRMVVSPQGMIPVGDEILLSSKYNLWVGYSNFDITNSVVKTIEDVQGVESLDIFSRYRFRIGIGKLFDEVQTKLLIEEVLGCITNSLDNLDDETRECVENMIKEFDKPWCIFVLPNGEVMSYVGEELKVKEKLKYFESVQVEVSGNIFSNVI